MPRTRICSTTTTIQFLTPTTYSVNGAGSFAYTSGGNMSTQRLAGADQRHARRRRYVHRAEQRGRHRATIPTPSRPRISRRTGVLSNGTISISGAVGALISGAGALAQQVNTAQTAQTAVNTQAQTNVQSISGVNLDEEAANLMQWQQAYQASAQALSVANSLFTTLLDSINGTFS